MLAIDKAVTEDIEEAVEQLTAYHDALRFEYHWEARSGWQQEYGSTRRRNNRRSAFNLGIL